MAILAVCFLQAVFAFCQPENPAEPNAPFSLTRRTPYNLLESGGIRIDFSQPDLEWRVIAAPTVADFAYQLKEAEQTTAFDLVFPLVAMMGSNPAAPESAYPLFLADSFHPLSLPKPGLEFRIAFDGIWDAAQRSSQGQSIRLFPFGQPQGGVALDALNAYTTSPLDGKAAIGWTSGFAQTALLQRLPRYSPSQWIALRRVPSSPWSGQADLPPFPIQDWNDQEMAVTGASDRLSPFSDDLLLRLTGGKIALFSDAAAIGTYRLQVTGLRNASRCPILIGGTLPIVRADKWIGPESPDSLTLRPDLRRCFSSNPASYSWIGISFRKSEVWMGCAGSGPTREAPMPPRDLARSLESENLDYAAICTASDTALAFRWQGQWIGARSSLDPGNIRAALCLRLKPAAFPRWQNILRDWRVAVSPVNADDSGSGLPRALTDGRVWTGGAPDSFWWAVPRNPAEPVAIEFDLQAPQPVYWIETLHAQNAGFSSHFNLPNYTWQIRSTASSNWEDVVEVKDNHSAVTRHTFATPQTARWWRLLIPPQEPPMDEAIPRLAEIEFWTTASGN